MTKHVAAIAVIFATTAAFVLAQSETKKSAAPNTDAPAKVSGNGVKTDSGLQYWDIRVGNGDKAKEGSHVRVHYTGWLTTGKKFDSSVDAGKPFDFTIGNGEVIKGWEEGVTGMRVNGKRQLRIPPNATLIFDIKLLGAQ